MAPSKDALLMLPALSLLRKTLDNANGPDQVQKGDFEKVRYLLADCIESGLSSWSSQPAERSLCRETEIISSSTCHIFTDEARVVIRSRRRRAARRQQLREFYATVTRVPVTAAEGIAVTTELRQLATDQGLLTLPPTIAVRAVIDPNSEAIRLVDLDDLSGIERLLRSGQASVRDCDPFGRTLLHHAARNSGYHVWDMLISHGVDVDCTTTTSTTALGLCSGNGYHHKMRRLLEAGADPALLPRGLFGLANLGAAALRTVLRVAAPLVDQYKADEQGRTLLLHAAVAVTNFEQPVILRLLINAGADVNHKDHNGNDAFHLLLKAIRPEHLQCVRSLHVLIQAGANPAARNAIGQSSMDIACAHSQELGSFRRNALAIVLARCDRICPLTGCDKLLAAPSFTPRYTWSHLRGLEASLSPDERTSSIIQLIDQVDYSGPMLRHKLQEAAVDRAMHLVLSSEHAQADASHAVSRVALQYLLAMTQGRKCLDVITKSRLCYPKWRPIFSFQQQNHLGVDGQQALAAASPSGSLAFRCTDVWHTSDEAEVMALLDFDWLRAVDKEDLYASYIDHLIELVTERFVGVGVAEIVAILEETVPSYQELVERRRCDVGCKSSVGDATAQLARRDSMSPDKERRPASILSTPVEFYNDWKEAIDDVPSAQGQARPNSICQTPLEFYDRRLWRRT